MSNQMDKARDITCRLRLAKLCLNDVQIAALMYDAAEFIEHQQSIIDAQAREIEKIKKAACLLIDTADECADEDDYTVFTVNMEFMHELEELVKSEEQPG